MENPIFSHGKLLLTSEYVVLDGALALAVPTKPGQELFYEENNDGKSLVNWQAKHQGKPWLELTFNYKTWEILNTNLHDAAQFVVRLFQQLKEMNSEKLVQNSSYKITTNLQFPADYGLGSSSTLMFNISVWAGVDAFDLNEAVLGGSGYDIAVARMGNPILYQTVPERTIVEIDFDPPFKDELIFIHLNQKQNSREGITMYRQLSKDPSLIQQFTDITQKAVKSKTIDEFKTLMTHHEDLLSKFLGIPTIKAKEFSDYTGMIKSLGAWGGDFIMASKQDGYQNYFSSKNFTTILEWKDLITCKSTI